MVITLFEIPGQSGKYGYEIEYRRSKIRQEHAPALNGLYFMTQQEAQSLAELIEAKLTNNLAWGVTEQQVNDLWDNIKTIQQIIDEELALPQS